MADPERIQQGLSLITAQRLEAVGQLTAGIAHEISSPIQYASFNLDFLGDVLQRLFRLQATYRDLLEAAVAGGAPAELIEQADGAELDEDLAHMRAEAPGAVSETREGIARITAIVSAMRDHAHPGDPLPIRFDLNQAIESTIELSRGEWRRQAWVVTDLDPELPPVIGFPEAVRQVVLTLILDAARALEDRPTTEPGTITLSSERHGDSVSLRVADDRPGTSTGVREGVFDPSFTTKAAGRGIGQGLSIVHRIVVDQHHGSVALEPAAGEGVAVEVTLPLDPSESDASAAA